MSHLKEEPEENTTLPAPTTARPTNTEIVPLPNFIRITAEITPS
jgi:hypothetical protein